MLMQRGRLAGLDEKAEQHNHVIAMLPENSLSSPVNVIISNNPIIEINNDVTYDRASEF
jgi:hypothetical protein